MNKVLQLLVWLLPVVFLMPANSCKKKADESPPSISVSMPYNGQEFKVGDSLHVLATISSPSDISSIKISLVNGDGVPMLVPKYLYPGTTQFNVDYMLPINENLENKAYSLLVSATNSYHTKKAYTEVFITGPGKYFSQLIASCWVNTGNMAVYSIDSQGVIINRLNLQHRFVDSDISSVHQQIYIVRPSSQSILQAYNLETWELDFVAEPSPPNPEFTSVYMGHDPELVYVTSDNGQIKGYSNTGISTFVTAPNADTVMVSCSKHDNKILGYCAYWAPQQSIRQYWAETGVYRTSLGIGFDVVDFFMIDADINLIFGDHASGGKVYTYNVTANTITGEQSMGVQFIASVVRTGESTFLFSSYHGIYSYDHSLSMVSTWKSGEDIHIKAFDEIRQIVYVSDGLKLYYFRYPDGLQLNEITMPHAWYNLHIHYSQ